ncbi:hypothetical protein [Bartonella sp. B1099]|uniref:hypothetical protein n=1 Tax=Bartonella sp. B1099 TaxID=2911422 RepID=UPI0020C1C64D|nr:hypothetical protein [Bartonella sp. B1099]
MKSFSITLLVTFITLFFVSVLLGCTSVDSLEKYNKLYEEYISQNYGAFEHLQKEEQAKKFVYSHGYQNIAPKFDVIRHRHILIVLCGRFVDLLRGDYNEGISADMLLNVISSLRNDYNWRESDFIWAYNMSMNSADPMMGYAKKFLNSSSGNGMSPKAQIIDLVSRMRTDNNENTKQIARFCIELHTIYDMMQPRGMYK